MKSEHFDDFNSGYVPNYIHLLRIKSLGQLSAYVSGRPDSHVSRLVDHQLEKYRHIGSPLLRLCADSEADNVAIDRVIQDEIYGQGTEIMAHRDVQRHGEFPEELGLRDDELKMMENLILNKDMVSEKLDSKLRELYRRQCEYDEYFAPVDVGDEAIPGTYLRVAKDSIVKMGLSSTVAGFRHIPEDTPVDAHVINLQVVDDNIDPYLSTEYASLYEPYILGRIMDETGIELLSLELESQQRLFEFMMKSDDGRYQRLIKVARDLPHDESAILAKAFLSTEFGDDHGEAILDIAENATTEQSTKIFETVNSLRQRSHEYAEMFASIDPEFAKQTEKALNERTTDMLTALQEVAVNGSLDEDVSPARNTPGHESNGDFDSKLGSLDEAIEVFGNLDKTFAKQQEILQADDLQISHVNEDSSQFTLYRFNSKTEGNMLLYVRPEGAYGYDRAVEYGNHAGVEASMSFVVDPVNPRKLLLPKSADGVSIRFDREGRAVGEAPNSPDRDPTRQDGMVSIDVSSIIGSVDSMPVKIGRMVAAGNLIRSRREGTADSLHHNANYFDQGKYGSAKGFGELARKLTQQVEMLRRSKTQIQMAKRAFGRAA